MWAIMGVAVNPRAPATGRASSSAARSASRSWSIGPLTGAGLQPGPLVRPVDRRRSELGDFIVATSSGPVWRAARRIPYMALILGAGGRGPGAPVDTLSGPAGSRRGLEGRAGPPGGSILF